MKSLKKKLKKLFNKKTVYEECLEVDIRTISRMSHPSLKK